MTLSERLLANARAIAMLAETRHEMPRGQMRALVDDLREHAREAAALECPDRVIVGPLVRRQLA